MTKKRNHIRWFKVGSKSQMLEDYRLMVKKSFSFSGATTMLLSTSKFFLKAFQTGLDWTCEHYVTQCELATNPLSSYIPTNAWQIWWTELLTDNYFQKKVSLTAAMVPWETPDVMVAAFHGHPQAGCKQEPSCVGIFDLMHCSASVSLVHRQNPQCEGQNLRTVLFKQYQDKRICARLTGRSPFNMVHTC